ncbi:hypothetical protein [Amorphus orientalis]|uniref:Outer membrane murein-binding lipoprotein Lpp n=1 Tax=Amorphus orientalis TaxID=649198 RepID=A0AAE4AS97_9HYPH|nr:hypothetical protein [Amorphus orientalis]MDQ0316016.1 outer membrane murein-binding lipoprotein Lpp [Amorphus orientalis]
MPIRSSTSRPSRTLRAASAVLAAALVAGCSSTPGAPLIGDGSAVVPKVGTGNPVRRDGFPNVLVDPVSVEGTPLTAAEQAQVQADLTARRDAAQAQGAF